MTVVLLIDLALVVMLIGLALQVVHGRGLFRGIVFFVAFGLAMALVWARLGVPDLALADAAIGAGITGALMLAAFRRLVELDPAQADPAVSPHSPLALAVAVLAATLVAVIGLTTIGLEHDAARAGSQVMEHLPETGLGNPVTGVLLVFRGLDTLLEMVVLLAALLGARIVSAGERAPVRAASREVLPLVGTLCAIVIPLTVLVAMHLLIQGADEAGGAFQAGSVLAAAGVLLLLSGRLVPGEQASGPLRFALVLGIAAFLLMAGWPVLQGQGLLGQPGKGMILAVEAAMMLSIGMTLMLLFSGSAGLKAGPS